jgi:hypothetical protein
MNRPTAEMSDAKSEPTPGFSVGQTVFVARSQHGRGMPAPEALDEVKITKLGRRWISLVSDRGWPAGRFDATTRALDGEGYSSPGSVWTSREEYTEHLTKITLWAEIRTTLNGIYGAPNWLSVSDMQTIKRLLKGEKS